MGMLPGDSVIDSQYDFYDSLVDIFRIVLIAEYRAEFDSPLPFSSRRDADGIGVFVGRCSHFGRVGLATLIRKFSQPFRITVRSRLFPVLPVQFPLDSRQSIRYFGLQYSRFLQIGKRNGIPEADSGFRYAGEERLSNRPLESAFAHEFGSVGPADAFELCGRDGSVRIRKAYVHKPLGGTVEPKGLNRKGLSRWCVAHPNLLMGEFEQENGPPIVRNGRFHSLYSSGWSNAVSVRSKKFREPL